MIILGLTQVPNGIAAALVRDGKYLINAEVLVQNKFQEELLKFLENSEVEMTQLDYIAYDDNFEVNTEFIEAPSLIINKELAHKYSLFIVDDDAKEDDVAIDFPYLLIEDITDETKVTLVSGLDNIKEITSLKQGSLSSVVDGLEDILDINNIFLHAFQGDDNDIELSRLDQNKANFDFGFILEEVKGLLDEFIDNQDNTVSEEVNAELLRNYKQDLASEALGALYDSLVIYLVTAANELGVQNIALVGEFADVVELRQKFTEQTESSPYEVFFPIREEELSGSIGIAGLAYIGVQ
ncbi:hypothetical protein KC909_02290 [Candidatus Dojkabacteria bacterium]|uniref:Uncharacterized protein n=1 Tax=Candidatus Dojkabacteria bacterium TaxID=2099670 RepID=A0A955RIR7_9BACT|nr:hypothetical protein [Candidatus Dojkabacteria bacterium]